jgi:uncharacterized membrane protein
MRLMIVLGAVVAFLAAVIVCFLAQKPLGTTISNAIFAAVLAAIGFRWWGKIWISSSKAALQEAQLEAMAAEHEKAAAEEDDSLESR